ncbi:MAG: hypothetical protein ACREQ5_14710 [Candidatus Dormibacteria bacterium]
MPTGVGGGHSDLADRPGPAAGCRLLLPWVTGRGNRSATSACQAEEPGGPPVSAD